MLTQYCASVGGLISMPTEMKKMAAKTFFSGVINFSIRCDSTVSARIEPMTKAPRALLNPASSAVRTIPSQIDDLAGQFGTFELMTDGDAGEQHHQHDRHDILHNQDAGGSLDETLLFHACLINGLHHDSGARHTKHTRQEKGVDHI